MELKNFTISELKSNLFLTDKIFIGVKAQELIENNSIDDSTVLNVKETVQNFYIELVLQLVQRLDFGRDDIKTIIIITPANVISNEESDITPLLKNFNYLSDSDPDAIITQFIMLKIIAKNI